LAAGFYAFANWAFSAHGLKDLRVLAYRNFNDVYQYSYLILCQWQEKVATGLSVSKHINKQYYIADFMDPDTWADTRNGQETLYACPLKEH
jgi:hypothetical protein